MTSNLQFISIFALKSDPFVLLPRRSASRTSSICSPHVRHPTTHCATRNLMPSSAIQQAILAHLPFSHIGSFRPAIVPASTWQCDRRCTYSLFKGWVTYIATVPPKSTPTSMVRPVHIHFLFFLWTEIWRLTHVRLVELKYNRDMGLLMFNPDSDQVIGELRRHTTKRQIRSLVVTELASGRI